MSLTSEELVAKLEAAGVPFTPHTHAAVRTVEAQEAALTGKGGTVIKNLFLKDKKNRYYIVSAMPETKVDLNVLSARLGTGKGGVRFAPEDALEEVLHVSPGSVTPLAVSHPGTDDVVLFLDHRIQQASGSLFVHPLVNTVSLEMSGAALQAALKAVGREPLFVDLEANPKIDKDNPPDLAQYTRAAPLKPEMSATTTPEHDSGAHSSASLSTQPAAKASTGKEPVGKKTKEAKGAATKSVKKDYMFDLHQGNASVQLATQAILDNVSEALGGGDKALSRCLDSYVLRRLTADIESHLTVLKNSAYAMGYIAGKEEVVAYARKQFT